MPTKRRVSLQDRGDLLARNEMVNVDIVAAYEKLEQDLRTLGVEIKPSFKLEPPLGQGAKHYSRLCDFLCPPMEEFDSALK